MKIHDLEYLILRSLRRIRLCLAKSYRKGKLSNGRLLRFFALVALSLVLVDYDFTVKKKETPKSADFGIVLSSTTLPATPTPTPFPRRLDSSPDLDPILAKSALVIDASSSAVLYSKESNLPLPPASTTKLMTALVALERFGLDEIITVPKECTLFDGGSKVGFKTGEQITVEDALYGLLVSSASDSACALARHGGGDMGDYVSAMNEKAKELGMVNTTYRNVSGMDEAAEGNVSTAEDIIKLSRGVLENQVLRRIVANPSVTINSADGVSSHALTNTNELLNGLPGTTGIKTGYTDKAGGCLVFSFNQAGREIIGVVLGSTERGRFEDTKKIIDWVFRVYTW